MQNQGISQEQLANVLGCTQTSVSRLLRGKTALSVDDLYKISKALGTNPAVLVEEALIKLPENIYLPNEVQEIYCSDAVGFQIFNRLKKPMTEEELLKHFSEPARSRVPAVLDRLRKLGAIYEDLNSKLQIATLDAESIYLKQDDSYNDRISELFKTLRNSKGDLTRMTPAQISEWKRKNGDALIMDYFTESQIIEQKKLILQLFNFIKSQLRSNKASNAALQSNPSDSKELRAIFLSSLPYPDLKEDDGFPTATIGPVGNA